MSEIDLEALADRVEKLVGPCRETDAEICELLTGSVESDDGDYWYGPHDEMPIRVPGFSASIDAAMSLVPKGWWWRVGECSVSSDATVGPDVAYCSKEMLVAFDEGFDVVIEPPSNVAIALTVACLRARASLSRLSPPPTEVKDNG